MRYKSIIFCSADPTKNAGNISGYFKDESEVFTAFHFFPGYVKRKTYTIQYKNRKKVLKKTLPYSFDNVFLKNISDFLFFSYTLLFLVPRGSFLITNAPIYCMFNFIFKFLKSIKYVLWIGDYYPDKSWKMRIYNYYVDYLNKNIEYVLYLSPPLYKIYSGKRSNKKYTSQVSLGIKSVKKTKKTLKKHTLILGFIGIIRKQQGLDLVFEYLKNAKDVKFEVIGTGYDAEYYKKLARRMGIANKVKFYGIVEDVTTIFSKWDIGLALYVNSKDNLSRYCEPTKLKDFMSHNLPAITTKTTYFSSEISKSRAGIIINEDIEELKDAVLKLKKNYGIYLHGIVKINEKYEYKSWYDRNFGFLS